MDESKKTDPEKTASNSKAQISVAVDQDLTDDDLDQVIAENDPEFLQAVQEIGGDKDLSLSQIVISDEDQALNEEKDAWENSGRIGKLFYKALPGLPVFSLKLKKLNFTLFALARAAWVRLTNFLYFLATDGKNKVIQGISGGVGAITGSISESIRQFKFLRFRLKIAVLAILFLAVGTAAFIYRSFTQGVVPVKDELFIPTLERVASDVYEYDPATEAEPFYENLRAPTNILLIPKIVVNLKRSSTSGSNPMGAFEFFIEGMSPEAVIEIKDREVEIRDRMQRGLEEISFDQADTPEGKKFLCEKLKKEINLILTTGKIKRIWIKTIILKP